jgi:NAD(P)-dependent dehydrogenase (short-subunit alcohol dehydrogenase family)
MNTSSIAPRKLALITGGSRGLGRSAALQLAQSGWDLVITYRERADDAEATVATATALGATAVALQLDTGAVPGFTPFTVTLAETLRGAFGRDHLDALVNNAGHSSAVPFAETSEREFDSLMNVHLKGVFFLTQALLPYLADGATILNVSSGLARFCAPGKTTYAVMKGGVEVLTRYLAKELGPRGIRAIAVAPGAVATDFGGGIVRDNPQVNAHVAANTALGRVGQPDDIGTAVAALLSDAMGWVNGVTVEASGGMFL